MDFDMEWECVPTNCEKKETASKRAPNHCRRRQGILHYGEKDADHYEFACPLTKDFHWVSLSQNAKKAWFQSIVRNPSIHFQLKSCIEIAYSIRDQIL
ncbi:hypothetical protein TNCV_2483671 [Trichonephila clavipes]|uniref:Uncharacterized protein n=1 Tax=Trichonephila clavipes TaxID=2585209 RepID=A0A8X7BAN9_TRICX|nr:hypothetical protein TNCV_2483671 [Trichonephila clavipes]